MALSAGYILAILLTFSLTTACGGGGSKGAAEDSGAAADITVTPPTKDSKEPVTQTPKAPISKGEATDVQVPTDKPDEQLPSLTLFNMGNTSLNWNDVGAAGTSYAIYKKPKNGSFDNTPFQTLTDMSAFSLPETAGTWCYIITATLPGNKGKVDSNEVCVTGPALLTAQDPGIFTLSATRNWSFTWSASGGTETPVFSCIEACPTGLVISEKGDLSWTPSVTQIGTHNPKIRIKSGSQTLEKIPTLIVTEGPLTFAALVDRNIKVGQTLSMRLEADAPGATLAFSCSSNCPAGLQINAGDGELSWSPGASQVGSYNVTVAARTATQNAEQILKITVDETQLILSSLAAVQGVATQSLQGVLEAAAGSHSITYSCIESCPQGFAVASSTGAWTWTPAFDQAGTYAVKLQARTAAQTQMQTLNLTITEAPLNFATPAPAAVKANQNLSVQLVAEASGAPITFACEQNCPTGLTVSSSGLVSWTPSIQQLGSFNVVIKSQALSQTQSKTLAIEVTEAQLNFNPISAVQSVATQPILVNLNAEAGGHSIEYACQSACPAGLQVDAQSGAVTWTPAFDQAGTYAVVFEAHTASQSALQTLSITVSEYPIQWTAPDVKRVTANQSLVFTVQANAGGAPIIFSCASGCPAGLTVSPEGEVRWQPQYFHAGQHTVTLNAKAQSQNMQQALTIIVDEAPLTFTAPALVRAVATEAIEVNLQAEAGGQALEFTCVDSCPEGLTVTSATGLVRWTPTAQQFGDFNPMIRVRSGSQNDQKVLPLQVLEAFVNLRLTSTSALLGEHTIAFTADPHSNLSGTLSYSLQQIAGPNVTTQRSGSTWSFLAPNVRQATNFIFRVTGTIGNVSRQEDITLYVLPNDHLPVISALTNQTAVASEAFTLQVSATDEDGDTLTYSCVLDCPSGFDINASTGLITWTPNVNQVGSYSPVLQVAANGRTVTAALNLVVMMPSMNITGNSISGISGNTVTIEVALSSNLRGPFQYSISQISGPTVSLSGANGTWSFTVPSLNFPANVSFDVIVGNGLYTQTQTLTGRLDPEPIAPTVDVGPDLVTNKSVRVSAQTSPNAQTFTWTKVSGPGTLAFSSSNAAATDITASAEGSYTVRLSVANSWGQTAADDLILVWDTTAPSVSAGVDANTNAPLLRTAIVSGAQTLSWSQTSGPGSLSFTAPSAATTTIDATMDGDYVVRLTGADAAGNSAFSEFNLRFDKSAPSIDLGPAIVTNLSDVTLNATVSSDVDTLVWTKSSGPGVVSFANANQEDTSANFSLDGLYRLLLTATDTAGNTQSAILLVTIDRSGPVMSGISLAPAVSDGYLNLAEHNVSDPLILVPSATDLGTVTFGYRLVTAVTTCNGSLAYAASMPLTDDAVFTAKGSFKVCVQARDNFNQATYGESSAFLYDTGSVTVLVSGLPSGVSSANSLMASASGSEVTHYAFKIGDAAITSCSDSSGYSSERDASLPLSTSLSSVPDGLVRFCAIGRNISGNWQPTSAAFSQTWTLDRTAPAMPENLTLTPLTRRIKFSWTPDPGASGYLIVRKAVDAITWTPTAGTVYSVGQDVDNGLTVVNIANSLPSFDNNVSASLTYRYAVFAYDSAYNYSPGAQESATARASVAYNVADGFDRTARIVIPARDGSGKYYVAGDFLVYGTTPASRLIRLNADLTVDTSFVAPAFNNIIYALASSTDGKVYVGGAFTSSTGITHVRLIRLQNNGSVDGTFNVGTTGFSSTVQTLALDESLDRLYVGGAFTTYKGTAAARLVALKTFDGSIDTNFNCGTCISAPSTATVFAINVISGQGIYVGGSFTTISGLTLNRIARLNASGVVDTNFTTTTGTIGFDNTVYAIERDSTGLYVGGTFTKYRGSSNASRLTRLLIGTGTIDATWPITNKFNGTVFALNLEPSGSLYVAGDFTAYGTTTVNRLARLSSAGILDSTFPVAGGVMSGLAANAGFPVLSLTSSSSDVIAVGSFQRYGADNVSYILRSNRSGTLLGGSPRGTMFNSSVFALAKTANAGEYLIGGSFTTFKGATAYRVARVNASGSMDTSVAAAITTTGSIVYALAVDPSNSKFYAGGTFTAPSGRLARFNSNGTADTTFNSAITTTGFNSDVYALAYDPGTGGVYVGGRFTTLRTTGMAAATTVNYLVRLLPNGTLDTSFTTGTGFNGQVNALQLMDDGTLLVGGSFTAYNGVTANRLIRLNSDGSPAASFDIGTGFNGAVQALTWVKSEKAIYVAGAFTTLRGVSANRLAKIDEAGLEATGWKISTGLSGTAFALSWDSDQEVLWVGGNFSTVRSVSSPRIAGINRDGTLHSVFNPGPISLNGDVRALQADGWGLTFGGTPSTYRNAVMDYIGRFLFDGTLL